jgi:hypothetical protein
VIVLSDLAFLSGALYLLPVLVGWIRRAPHMGSVAAVNMLLGWTVIGWVAALAIVLRPPDGAGATARIPQPLPGAPEPSRLPQGHGPAGRQALHARRDGSPPPLKLPARPAGSGTCELTGP